MNIRRPWMTFASPLGLLAALCLSASAMAQPAGPETLTPAAIDQDARQISSSLEDTIAQINEAGTRKDAKNLNGATAAGMRALSRLFEVAKSIDAHPRRIEQLQKTFFGSEAARERYRLNYREKLRPKYFEVEQRIEHFAADLQRQGYSAVMVALGQVRTWMNSSDATARQNAEKAFNSVASTFSNDGGNNADNASDKNKKALEQAGGTTGGGTSGGPGTGGGGTTGGGGRQELGNSTTAQQTAAGVEISKPGSPTATIKGATLLPDGKVRLKNGEIVDLKGSETLADGSIRLADGSFITKEGEHIGAGRFGASDAKYEGDVNFVPDDFTFDPTKGEARGVNKRYAGEKGGRLVQEQQVTIKIKPSMSAANTFTTSREEGASRSWLFSIVEVPGSRKKAAGAKTITYAFTDRNGGTAFTNLNWEITGSAGSPSLSSNTGAQVTVTFTNSGTYNIRVSGKTDWESPFAISNSVQIDVNVD